MKKLFLLIYLIYFTSSYSQDKEYIYFKIDHSIKFDSITFNAKNIASYNNTIKIEKKKFTKFLIHKGNHKICVKIKNVFLDRFNIISLNKNLDESFLNISKGDHISKIYLKKLQEIHHEINIDVFNLIIDDGLKTKSMEFNIDIKSNPGFFGL